MNTVEDRLTEALRERAAHSPIDPGAWERTLARVQPSARVPRAARGRAWSRFLVPAAAAAAVVAIVAGATVLTGHEGQRGGSGATGTAPTSSSSVAGAPAPPDSLAIKGTKVLSAIIPVKLTSGKHTIWVFVWFSRRDSGPDRSLQLCTLFDSAGFSLTGACQSPPAQARPDFVKGTGAIEMSVGDQQFGSAMTIAVSDPQVTSVTAQFPHGGSVSGVSAWGRGFPYKVWLVDFPAQDNATIVMGNAAGQVVKRLSIAGTFPLPPQPPDGGIKLFSFPADSLSVKAGTMTAYLINGSGTGTNGWVVDFWGSEGSSFYSNDPVSGPPAVVEVPGDGWLSGAEVAEFFGYAHANVARVVLRLPDGSQYSAPTTAAWPASGVRLWHFAVPVKTASYDQSQQVLLGYNAAGQVVSR